MRSVKKAMKTSSQIDFLESFQYTDDHKEEVQPEVLKPASSLDDGVEEVKCDSD